MRMSSAFAALATGLLVACGSSGATTPTTVTVLGYTVTITSAPPTTAQAGTSIPIAFRITENESDGTSKAASGKTMTVAVTSGGGTIGGAASTTLTSGSDGTVSTTWVLGSTVGTQSVRGSVSSTQYLDVTVAATQAAVASVSVTLAPTSIAIGASAQAQGVAKDASGATLTGRIVVWSTNSATVATVSQAGVVTGVTAGTATITATVEGMTGSATVTVTPVPVASVTVTPGSVTLTLTGSAPLAATARDAAGNVLAGRTVVWSSSPASVASVSTDGVVTPVSAGTTTVSATIEGHVGSATVTITAVPVATVTVSPGTGTIVAGQTLPLTATPKDAGGNPLSGRAVAWTTSDPTVATVSGVGTVTGFGAGTATITATSEGKSASAVVTVTQAPVATVTVAPGASTLSVGQAAGLSATMRDNGGNALSGRTVVWSSNALAVASVSALGVVTGVSAGVATITATSEGIQGTASVTVTAVPVATITLTPNPATLPVGQIGSFTIVLADAVGNPLSGRTVVWSSANPSVATVTVSGVVSGIAAGTTTITASSEGKTGTATLTVTGGSASICTQIAGSLVYGFDVVSGTYATYIGRLTNQFDLQSIYNQFGTYGSQFSSLSMNNQFSTWGSQFSAQSAFNQFASNPPILVKNGVALAYFTINQFKSPYVTPAFAAACTFP